MPTSARTEIWLDVAHEARRERTDRYPGKEVADDRRLAQADGDDATDEGRADRAAEAEDERELLRELECRDR